MRWSQEAGLLTPEDSRRLLERAGREPAEADRALRRALSLREGSYRVLVAAGQGQTPSSADLSVLNEAIRDALGRIRVAPSATGFEWSWAHVGSAFERMLWPIARSAGELLTSPELPYVKTCDGDDCAWLFLDTSRNRTRRWCEMADCGNRAKVRRFRERHRSGSH